MIGTGSWQLPLQMRLYDVKTRDFSSNAEVEELVAAFEEATIPAADFNHVAHIAVALAYLEKMPQRHALERMREKIRAFAEHHGVGNLYHETLTTFWMKLLDHVGANCELDLSRRSQAEEDPARNDLAAASEVPLWQRINAIVARWGNRGPVDAHYTREAITSDAARKDWVPPDREPLPF